MSGPVVLSLTRTFAAPPARVFDAWLDPAQACQFLFATEGGEVVACEIDARVGGSARIVDRRAGGDAVHHLRYEVIERPHLLVFLFAAGAAEEGEWTRVSVAIAPSATGCTLALTHEMSPQWADYEAQTRQGWTMILSTLARIMEKADA
jgi:uncharacterized protein YndB with AHSA1/START domain